MSRDGVELADGRPGYISTRLKIVRGAITEVEFSSDVARANGEYVWSLPVTLTAVLSPDQRSTREALEALGRRYFQSLTDHKAVVADFDDTRCNRFHSGNQMLPGGASGPCA